MKHLLAILFVVFALTGCEKTNHDTRDDYVGNWDFEVTYTSNFEQTSRETVVNCQGMLIKSKDNTTLQLHYCMDNYLLIKIDNEGVVRDINNKLLGVIEPETCLIVNNSPSEKSISKITIKGVK